MFSLDRCSVPGKWVGWGGATGRILKLGNSRLRDPELSKLESRYDILVKMEHKFSYYIGEPDIIDG